MTFPSLRDPAYHRLADGGRLVAIVIVGLPIVVDADSEAITALLTAALVWLAAAVADRRPIRDLPIVLAESALIGLVAGLGMLAHPMLLAILAIPPFVGGLRSGMRGVALSLAAALSALLTTVIVVYSQFSDELATNAVTWLMTGVALGMIASFQHAQMAADDPLAPYLDAQRHLRGLLELSGDLGSGLDPIALGSRIAVEARNELPLVAVAVHVPRGDELTPLVSGASAASVDQASLEPVVLRAWERGTPQVDGQVFAVPLRTDMGNVAVVSGILPPGTDPSRLGLDGRLSALRPRLAATAVHLDTALLFRRLREAATTEERRRLAREMHDGVAQDIASLGYLVDALSVTPTTDVQAEGLRKLRERITSVVAEVRRSVQTLRTDVAASESLGAAVSGLARHLSESAGIPIRVTINEQTARLRPEIESELLRIAQEAMNNAVKHAHATAIDVSIRVAAPSAEVTVRDDGGGLGPGREDSYGLAIMQERASLIDADLAIEAAVPTGTVVRVRIPRRTGPASRVEGDRPDRVSA
ncbi:MAG: sensor histidine kinase [Nocardioides sp.]